MQRIFGSLLLAVSFLAINAPFVSAATQPSSVNNLVAVSPDTWTAEDTRASYTLPVSSPAQPAASFIDDGLVAESDDSSDDVTIAPGRFEISNSRSISMSAAQMPVVMVMTPYRPMALEGPLAIPEPSSVLLFVSGMLALPFLLRGKRLA